MATDADLTAALDRLDDIHQPDGGACGTCADGDGQAAAWPCETAAALAVARQLLGTGEQRCPECGTSGACNGGPCPLASTGQPEAETPGLLTAYEGQFLAFALDQAAEELSLGAGFTVESAAALDRLRRLAAEAQQPTPAPTEERRQPAPVPCTNPCIACMADESHDPAPAEETK